jgi:hypothetical protein
MAMEPITAHELERILDASVDASGVWTFRDGSRGKFPKKPIAVYDDEHNCVGFSYFDRLDRLQ